MHAGQSVYHLASIGISRTLEASYRPMAVTSYIVFLLALNQVPGRELAERRTISTAIGAAIALGVRLVVISWRCRHWKRSAALLRRTVFP